jgi:sec-independent protein translocase protein TatA
VGTIGWPELLIILLVVLLIFGVGRIARVGGELGKGVSALREGLKDNQEKVDGETEDRVEPKSESNV